ncbi:MAG: hypothetical protein ABII82_13855 [Verrucomicrobiota bacterium]
MAQAPTPEMLDPGNARGPVLSAAQLAELRAALDAHLAKHAEIKAPDGTAISIPVVVVGNTVALGPVADGSWIAVFSDPKINQVVIWRVPPRQAVPPPVVTGGVS